MNTYDVSCDKCGADPGEPCEFTQGPNKGEPRRGYHRDRHDRASLASAAEASQKQREAEESYRRELALELAKPVETMHDVFEFLKGHLRLEVEEKITCPEEGMRPDVWVKLLLGGEEVDRRQLWL